MDENEQIDKLRQELNDAYGWLIRIQRQQGWDDLGEWLTERNIEWRTPEEILHNAEESW